MVRATTMATSFKIYASVLPTIGLPQPSRTYLHYCTREGHNTPIYLRTSGAQSSLAVALAGRAAEGAAQERSTRRPRHAGTARVARTHGAPARRAPRVLGEFAPQARCSSPVPEGPRHRCRLHGCATGDDPSGPRPRTCSSRPPSAPQSLHIGRIGAALLS